nr:probable serine/threonine-protein kinase roco5 isoform X1 [Tanacetum cinerariifolium]
VTIVLWSFDAKSRKGVGHMREVSLMDEDFFDYTNREVSNVGHKEYENKMKNEIPSTLKLTHRVPLKLRAHAQILTLRHNLKTNYVRAWANMGIRQIRGLHMNTTNYLQDNEFKWDQFIGEDKELTMWDVVLDMSLAA